MKAPPDPSPLVAGPVCCDLAAYALARLPAESLPELRRRPGPAFGDTLPAGFLKHVDEQTVAGLAAVFHAVRGGGLDAYGFREWGVLAAPAYLGQAAMATAWLRFHAEGAWGVSPHVIPHRSLHSLSGTVSHALKIQGPNLGVGGCCGSTADALLAAAALLAGRRVPGVWVVLTAVRPDVPLTPEGAVTPAAEAVGLALALLPEQPGRGGLRLRVRVRPEAPARDAPGGAAPPPDPLRLHADLDQLHRDGRGTGTRVVSEAGPRVEVEWTPPGVTAGFAVTADRLRAAGPVPTGAEAER